MLIVPHFSSGRVNIRSDQITALFSFLFFLFFFFRRSPVIGSALGVDTRSGFQQASTQTKANLGSGETFNNLIGAGSNSAIRA